MENLGNLHYFLGVEAHLTSHGLFLSQTKYAKDIIQRDTMELCKSYASPLRSKSLASNVPDSPFAAPTLYRSIVGALHYLTITCPDIAFAVNSECQHMHSLMESFYTVVKRIIRYMKGTLDHDLHFSLGPLILHAL